MRSRALPVLAAALLWLCAAPLAAQETPGDGPDVDGPDVDGLFEEPAGDADSGGAGQADEPGADDAGGAENAGPPALERLEEAAEPLDVAADVRFTGGYSPGWTEPLGTRGGEYDDLPVVELSSGIDLLLTISPALSISQKYRFEYPDYDFEIAELALDYTLQDAAFLTFGLTRVAWGRSPSFPFANLPGREAPAPLGPDEDENTIVARAVIPIGIGGIELLAQNRSAYQADIDAPRADRVGVGAKYNWARERLDLDIGGYYQAGMPGRLFVSGQTTATDWLEVYAEGLYADDRLRADDTVPESAVSDNNPDFAAAAGVVVGLFEHTLDLNAEYFYNGEELTGEVDGGWFPLFYGHNAALNLDYRIPESPLRLRAAYRYNETFGSSVFAPRLTIEAARHLTVDLAAGLLWGPADAGHRAENPDDNDRPAFAAVTFTLHGGIE